MSLGVYNLSDLVESTVSIEPILSTEVSMALDNDGANNAQQRIKAGDSCVYSAQNVLDLQKCISELQHNLQESIAQTEKANQEKEILQKRIQLLEKRVKCQPEIHQPVVPPLPLEPVPKLSNLRQATEYIRKLQQELYDTRKQLEMSESHRLPISKMESDYDDYGIPRQVSDSSSDISDALFIAEEMSYKVVLLQAEREELGDELATVQVENMQLKMMTEQLEQQVRYLVQQSQSSRQPPKRRGFFRNRLIRA